MLCYHLLFIADELHSATVEQDLRVSTSRSRLYGRYWHLVLHSDSRLRLLRHGVV